jgi:hypothetical protein
MASKATAKVERAIVPRAKSADVGRGTDAPSSWALGDGQQIPWEYAPAPESRDIVQLKSRYGMFIGGKEVAPRSGKWFTTVDPATEEPLAEVARATVEDVNQAVGVARRAFRRTWGEMPGRERAKYLFRIARILQERSREFAVLESLDGGKPIKESRDVDVPLAAAHFWYYAGWADKLEYAFPARDPRPLGVAAQVIPWNFPLLMLAWKIAPALAAGNTVVLKPASSTPLSALFFADVCRQADLPPGVVNIITGPGEIGLALVSIPTSTRSPSPARRPWARRSARHRRHGQGADPRAGRQGGQHRLRRRTDRPGDRGRGQRHLLQPGRGLLRRQRGCSCRSRSPSRSSSA